MARCDKRRRSFVLRGISLHLFAAAHGDRLQEDPHGVWRWASRDVDGMKPVCARRLSVWRGLIGGEGNAGMRPERRTKPGADGGLRAASWTAAAPSKEGRNLPTNGVHLIPQDRWIRIGEQPQNTGLHGKWHAELRSPENASGAIDMSSRRLAPDVGVLVPGILRAFGAASRAAAHGSG